VTGGVVGDSTVLSDTILSKDDKDDKTEDKRDMEEEEEVEAIADLEKPFHCHEL